MQWLTTFALLTVCHVIADLQASELGYLAICTVWDTGYLKGIDIESSMGAMGARLEQVRGHLSMSTHVAFPGLQLPAGLM